MKKLETHIVPKEKLDLRLSDYLLGKFETIHSRKGLKKAIERGLVKVNGKIGRTGDFIKGGETIELFQKKIKPKARVDIELEVLFEDDHLAMINKPAGVVVSGNKKRTIENALASNLTKSTQKDALAYPMPVHRLDLPTTGVLLIAKTNTTIQSLGKLFENRLIQKTYMAISLGKMENEGEIDSVIKNKKAKTSYKVLKTLPSDKYGGLNLVELNPETGRRHQLRIHLAEMGNPILGESKYGKPGKQGRGRGLYLHASRLAFKHPVTDEDISVEAKLPKKFGEIFG